MLEAGPRSVAAVTFLVLACISGPIAAQESLASGSRVRVTAPECELRGQAATFRAL